MPEVADEERHHDHQIELSADGFHDGRHPAEVGGRGEIAEAHRSHGDEAEVDVVHSAGVVGLDEERLAAQHGDHVVYHGEEESSEQVDAQRAEDRAAGDVTVRGKPPHDEHYACYHEQSRHQRC